MIIENCMVEKWIVKSCTQYFKIACTDTKHNNTIVVKNINVISLWLMFWSFLLIFRQLTTPTETCLIQRVVCLITEILRR